MMDIMKGMIERVNSMSFNRELRSNFDAALIGFKIYVTKDYFSYLESPGPSKSLEPLLKKGVS